MSEFSVRFYNGSMAPIQSIIDHADRSAFAATALAVKLRELDQACIDAERAFQHKNQVHRECEQLLIEADNVNTALRRRIYEK